MNYLKVNYLILEDDIEFLENCNIKISINKVFKMLQEDPSLSDWDLVYLGHSIRKKNLEAYNNIYNRSALYLNISFNVNFCFYFLFFL